ncbi:Acetolactate synthase isozyme 2 large subunit [Aquimixticola soesokkakensis]|uniref:Acetolactate synthase isozyme 2 large subunit n=1 Tax=Aquimixticola soesokkakensis TaxID=1519096 RepID=A0A1Y5RQV9_9RHOB|nr:thiamine pyrophosphate-binding protein [Aquimixticola soesokkakensis]SLN23002.1 Acetolactate synthase isozyme 2 large subunit [Aquimixticola soesokkakensis]
MSLQTAPRTAARVLVDQLVIQGIDRVFCVPGESFLAVLDALVDSPEIELVTCRHEGGAAMMAEAYAKVTGRPGVVFCSRGPGATNASSGLHVAFQDSTPFLMFIGQNPRDVMTREGFQEVDYRRMFGTQAKAVLQLDDAERTSEFVTRAFQLALSGRPGPVVIPLPEDMLTDTADCIDGKRATAALSGPTTEHINAVRARIAAAKRPVVMLGGSGWTAGAVRDFRAFAEASDLPVCASFRRQDLLDNQSPSYIGEIGLGANPALLNTVKTADLLVVLGARLGEIGTMSYTIMECPVPTQELIHIYPDPDELGHVYQPDLAVVSNAGAFAQALAAGGPISGSWGEMRARCRADFTAWTAPKTSPGAIQMCEIMAWIDAHAPEDTIYTNGAGNFSVWLHRFHRYRQFGTQVAPICGSMGYGVPAALAAKFARPDAPVICIAGDGDFQMTGSELATAVAHKLKLKIILLNNGMLATIRMHQEKHFPGRLSGTQLEAGNPDFVAFAKAYGALGVRVSETSEFAQAFTQADAFDGPSLIEVMIDPEAISPNVTLSELSGAS